MGGALLLWGGALLLFAGIAVVVLLSLGGLEATRLRGTSLEDRMAIYTLGEAPPRQVGGSAAAPASGLATASRSAALLAGRLVHGLEIEGSLAHRLDQAALPLDPGEWLLVHAGCALGLALLLGLLSDGQPGPALLGLLVGVELFGVLGSRLAGLQLVDLVIERGLDGGLGGAERSARINLLVIREALGRGLGEGEQLRGQIAGVVDDAVALNPDPVGVGIEVPDPLGRPRGDLGPFDPRVLKAILGFPTRLRGDHLRRLVSPLQDPGNLLPDALEGPAYGGLG